MLSSSTPTQASLGCHHPQSPGPHSGQSGDRHRQEGILIWTNIRCLFTCSSSEGRSLRPSLPIPKGSQPGQQPTTAREAPGRCKAPPTGQNQCQQIQPMTHLLFIYIQQLKLPSKLIQLLPPCLACSLLPPPRLACSLLPLPA